MNVKCVRCGCMVKRGHNTELGKLCNDCYRDISAMNKHFEEPIITKNDDADRNL